MGVTRPDLTGRRRALGNARSAAARGVHLSLTEVRRSAVPSGRPAPPHREANSNPATQSAAIIRPAVNSRTIDSPAALSACTVAGQARRVSPSRSRSAPKIPPTKPIGSPTTGITKKPTTPSSPPTSSDDVGTPVRFRFRPGHRYLSTVPPAAITVAAASTAQRPGPAPPNSAHTSTPPQHSGSAGSPGTTTPASPAMIASAATTDTTACESVRLTVLPSSPAAA